MKKKTRKPIKRVSKTRRKKRAFKPIVVKVRKNKRLTNRDNHLAYPDLKQRIRFKNRAGKIIKNPRSDLKLIAEIIDSRGRVVGYNNYIKNGVVIPRRIAKTWQRYLKTQITQEKPEQVFESEHKFTINTAKLVVNQIASIARDAIMAIMRIAKTKGYCSFIISADTEDAHQNTTALSVPHGTSYIKIAYVIAYEIIKTIHDNNATRMSPKALAKRPKTPHVRRIYCTLKIFGE